MNLEQRIAAWMGENPGGHTSERVARGVHARDIWVRQILRTSELFTASVSSQLGVEVVRYALSGINAPPTGGRPVRAKQPSQSQRILSLLGDHRWHTHRELYALGCVAHSRLADLRKRGYEIEKRHSVVNGETIYEYRLCVTSTPSEHASYSGTATPDAALAGTAQLDLGLEAA